VDVAAYDRRCAISGLPLMPLLEAAHIIRDHDERIPPLQPPGVEGVKVRRTDALVPAESYT
jgi:hypothetical protein